MPPKKTAAKKEPKARAGSARGRGKKKEQEEGKEVPSLNLEAIKKSDESDHTLEAQNNNKSRSRPAAARSISKSIPKLDNDDSDDGSRTPVQYQNIDDKRNAEKSDHPFAVTLALAAVVAVSAFLIWGIVSRPYSATFLSGGNKQKSQSPPFCPCISNLEDDQYFSPLAEALGHGWHQRGFLGFWTRSSLSPRDRHQFPSQENFDKFISQFEDGGAKSCVNITHLTPSDAKDQETLLETFDTLQKPNTCSLVVLETSSKVWPQLDDATDGMASQGIKTYAEMVNSRSITYSKEKGTLVLLVHGKVPGHKRASSVLGTLFVPEEEPNKKE